MKRALSLFIAGIVAFSGVFAQETPINKDDDPRLDTPVPFTLRDRDRLHTVELRLEAMEKQIAQQFNAVGQQFNAVNQRIDDANKNLQATNDRMLWIFGILVAIGAAVFSYLNIKFGRMFEQVEKRFEQVDRRFELLESKMDRRFEQLENKFDRKFDILIERLGAIERKLERFDAKLEEQEKRQDRIEKELLAAR
jgi:tetrahydromethanopterin S-methyltransferase subunit G